VAPTALAFHFVRPEPGRPATSPAPAVAQEFSARGRGTRKSAAAVADPASPYATTSLSATRAVVLSNHGNAPVRWDAAPGSAWVSTDPASGAIAAGQDTVVHVSVDASALAAGTHTVQVAFTDGTAGTTPANLVVDVTVQTVPVLEFGTPVTGLSGAQESVAFYVAMVPAGTTSLSIRTGGGSGDADLYVRYGEFPTFSTYDCSPYTPFNDEECVVQNPQPGLYYVMIHGYEEFWGLELLASAEGPPGSPAPPYPPATRPYSATTLRTTWTDRAADETGFTVGRRTQTGSNTYSPWINVGTVAANSIRFTQTVPVGLAFQYRVRACTAAAAVAVPTVAPAAPSEAVAAPTEPARATVRWTDRSTDEASFTVTRSLLTDGVWGPYEAAGRTAANVTQLTTAGLLAGRTYRFQVNACNVAGCSEWTTSGATAIPAPPTPPSGVVTTLLPGTFVRLNWTDASDNERSFQVSRAIVGSTGVAGGYVQIGTVPPFPARFVASGLAPGTTYRFRVRACGVGGCSTPATSGDVVIAALPPVPTGLVASVTSPTQARLTWNDVDAETSYQLTRVLRNADGTWGPTVIVGSYAAGTTRVDDGGLAPASTYRYQLRACNLTGCSARITAVAATWAN
jgi:hypothetical protein